MVFDPQSKNLQKMKPIFYKHIQELFEDHPEINKFTFFCHRDFICDADYFFDDKSIEDYYCEHGEKACELLGLVIEEYRKFDNSKSWLLDELIGLESELVDNGFGNLKYRTLNEFWIRAQKQIMSELGSFYAKTFSNMSSLERVDVCVYRNGEIVFS